VRLIVEARVVDIRCHASLTAARIGCKNPVVSGIWRKREVKNIAPYVAGLVATEKWQSANDVDASGQLYWSFWRRYPSYLRRGKKSVASKPDV